MRTAKALYVRYKVFAMETCIQPIVRNVFKLKPLFLVNLIHGSNDPFPVILER